MQQSNLSELMNQLGSLTESMANQQDPLLDEGMEEGDEDYHDEEMSGSEEEKDDRPSLGIEAHPGESAQQLLAKTDLNEFLL